MKANVRCSYVLEGLNVRASQEQAEDECMKNTATTKEYEQQDENIKKNI